METEEEEEIEEVDILQEPRLMAEIDDFVEDAPIPASKKKKKASQGPTTVPKQRKNKCDPRRFQLSVTITLNGEDLDRDRFAPLLEEFVKNNTEKSIVAFERGEVECHLHVQCLMIAITTTPAAFKLSIERALFEKGTRPPNLVICCRQLTGRGMHCVQGLVGYCRKSKDQPDFVEICHNITKEDKDAGDLLYMLHGRSERSKTKVELNASNLINKMEVFLKYKTANILRHTSDPLCLILKMVSKSPKSVPLFALEKINSSLLNNDMNFQGKDWTLPPQAGLGDRERWIGPGQVP